MLFAHSWKDSCLVLISAIHCTLLILGALYFDQIPVPWLIALGGLTVFLTCTNYQCVAHNFLHNPFFRAEWLNSLFSIFNSLTLGQPQTLYRYHHLNHHQFNNDLPDPETRTTRDRSSTYRRGRRVGSEESIVAYSLLGPVRTELSPLYAAARAKGRARLVWIESAAMLAYVGLLAFLNWRFVLEFVTPVWFLGQAAALAENYLEHHHAVPGNRLTDSVSCYNRWYNWLWFNNGYHQEHHYRPNTHWTEVPALKAEMLPESERRVVRVAHWFNFGAGRPACTAAGLREPGRAILDEAESGAKPIGPH